jgi:hypothetical protein
MRNVIKPSGKGGTLEIENQLFRHIFFLSVRGELLPCFAYYVIRENKVYHINMKTLDETPSGDKIYATLGECEHLGDYEQKKIEYFESDYIPYSQMLRALGLKRR